MTDEEKDKKIAELEAKLNEKENDIKVAFSTFFAILGKLDITIADLGSGNLFSLLPKVSSAVMLADFSDVNFADILKVFEKYKHYINERAMV